VQKIQFYYASVVYKHYEKSLRKKKYPVSFFSIKLASNIRLIIIIIKNKYQYFFILIWSYILKENSPKFYGLYL